MRSNLPVINVYKDKKKKSPIVTQLLYGDAFKVIRKYGSWLKIKNNTDQYIGYIKNRVFPLDHKYTHKISVLSADLYSKPNNSKKINKKLSFGSRIKVIQKNRLFYKFDNFWVKRKSIKKLNFRMKNDFQNIKKFISVKYKWGGKHYSGVDCSGLIQLFLNFNNKYCPRDTKDQIKYFKKKIKFKNIKKNDLIFWKGHVALVLSKKQLIHGYGPFKKVVIMPIKKTIDRIYKTANLKVIGIRR